MKEAETRAPLPYFDEWERRILEEIKKAGGVVFRTDLRGKLGGSNTTFLKKIESLKERGIIEEHRRRGHGGGRLKTAYRFTEYATRLFNVEQALKMKRWFSASQRIELIPEFNRIAQALMGNGFDIYEMLGIEPQHMLLETLLATSEPLTLKDEEIREVLSMVNALFQNIVTGRLHPKLGEQVEGYIIFHYNLEKPKEELQTQLPQYFMDYLTSSDPLEHHRAFSKLVELAIRQPNLLPSMTAVAINIARALKLDVKLEDLRKRYESYRKGEDPFELTRIELMISALSVFKKLYDLHRERRDHLQKEDDLSYEPAVG